MDDATRGARAVRVGVPCAQRVGGRANRGELHRGNALASREFCHVWAVFTARVAKNPKAAIEDRNERTPAVPGVLGVELAGLEPAASWVRSRRCAGPDFGLFAGFSWRRRTGCGPDFPGFRSFRLGSGQEAPFWPDLRVVAAVDRRRPFRPSPVSPRRRADRLPRLLGRRSSRRPSAPSGTPRTDATARIACGPWPTWCRSRRSARRPVR